MQAYVFNHSIWDVEAGGSLSVMPAWSIDPVWDSQDYMEKLCVKKYENI